MWLSWLGKKGLKGRVKNLEWRSSPTCVGGAVKMSLLRIFTDMKKG